MLSNLLPPYDPPIVSSTIFIISQISLLSEGKVLLINYPILCNYLLDIIKGTSQKSIETEGLRQETTRFSILVLIFLLE